MSLLVDAGSALKQPKVGLSTLGATPVIPAFAGMTSESFGQADAVRNEFIHQLLPFRHRRRQHGFTCRRAIPKLISLSFQ